MNAHKPWAAVAYCGLLVSNWMFFGVACGAFKLRDRLVEGLGGGSGGRSGSRKGGKRVSDKKYY